ncbi:LppM family (lipo)protein [Demequina sp.]|uniref:LppM family (lipo)protein n=1 Tax=Demequina sp. TaxID=2050685 RepID=UPI003A881E95
MTAHATRRAAALAALATVLLAGCVRVTSDTAFHSDQTFSQHAIVAADMDALGSLLAGQGLDLDLEGLLGDLDESAALSDLQERYPGKIEVAEYADEDLTGVELTVTDMPLDELTTLSQEAAGLGAQASVDVVDGQYVVTMTMPDELDLTSSGLTSSNLDLAANAVDVEVTYSFPGPVTQASAGEIDGHSVTLSLADLLASDQITIVASASDQIDWGPWLRWGGVTLALMLIIGGAAALVLQDRRKRTTTHLPPPVTGTTPSGPGVLGENPEPPHGDGSQPPHRPS